jgi:hypothetical protein
VTSVVMGIVVGRKTSTITAMMASAHTTLQVNTTSFFSVRGRDRLDPRGLGAMSSAAAGSVEMGGLGA